MRPRVLVRTSSTVGPGAGVQVRQHVIGGMRSRVAVVAVPIAVLAFERHLVGHFERLTQRQDDFGRLVL